LEFTLQRVRRPRKLKLELQPSSMPILTELGNLFGPVFYKDVAPTALKNIRFSPISDSWPVSISNRA
jgi:hypothetical protein